MGRLGGAWSNILVHLMGSFIIVFIGEGVGFT